jgi:hypothetical protein
VACRAGASLLAPLVVGLIWAKNLLLATLDTPLFYLIIFYLFLCCCAGDVRHRAVLGQIMAVVVEEMLARNAAVNILPSFLFL